MDKFCLFVYFYNVFWKYVFKDDYEIIAIFFILIINVVFFCLFCIDVFWNYVFNDVYEIIVIYVFVKFIINVFLFDL